MAAPVAGGQGGQRGAGPRFLSTTPGGDDGGAERVAGDDSSDSVVFEERLRQQCEELEWRLHQDPLSFENETLSVQKAQAQDDITSLKEDLRGMEGYFEQRLAEMWAQLEEQQRAANTAESHADCLTGLLHFHEDQGQLQGSYWRAQCEKRDDSIRFLTLKLQEYTVPSSEYRARCQGAGLDAAAPLPGASPEPPQPPAPRPPDGSGDDSARARQSTGEAYQTLLQSHAKLCHNIREHQEEAATQERALEACELQCAALCAARSQLGRATSSTTATATADPAPAREAIHVRSLSGEVVYSGRKDSLLRYSVHDLLKELGAKLGWAAEQLSLLDGAERLKFDEPLKPLLDKEGTCELILVARNEDKEAARPESEQIGRLRAEVEACKQALQEESIGCEDLPTWAQRCTWRDQLDVRAGQLERISLKFDATKRSLDAANEELQWQATSAEALRMRLAEVLRTTQAEELKDSELNAERMQREAGVQELLEQWASLRGVTASHIPSAWSQAQWLLESISRSDVQGNSGNARVGTSNSAIPPLPPLSSPGAVFEL